MLNFCAQSMRLSIVAILLFVGALLTVIMSSDNTELKQLVNDNDREGSINVEHNTNLEDNGGDDPLNSCVSEGGDPLDSCVSGRDRKLTEKGHAYQMQMAQREFRLAVSAWRKRASEIECLLVSTENATVLKEQRGSLAECFDRVSIAFNKLDILSDEGQNEFYQKYEEIEHDDHKLTSKIADFIRDIDMEKTASRSRRSYHSHHTRTSKVSHRSSLRSDNSKRADVAAEAAALKTQLKYIDCEAQKRAEYERLRTLKELEMAEAKLQARNKIAYESEMNSDFTTRLANLPEESSYTRVKTYVSSQTGSQRPIDNAHNLNMEESNLNGAAHHFTPKASNITQTKPDPSLCTLIEHMTLNRLPLPEPSVFTGDALKYPSWKSDFFTLIESKSIPPMERIHYLKRYLGGAAREAVESYFLVMTEHSFNEAKSLLDERYGNPYVIANAFRDRLEQWPKIGPRDGKALLKFSDFLRQCNCAMKNIDYLSVLDDARENRKLLTKLPDWLVNRWGRLANDFKERTGKFPPFCEFAFFVAKEANIACDPLTSLQALKSSETSDAKGTASRQANKRSYGASNSFATNTTKPPKTCFLCKGEHHLDDCRQFTAKSLEERKQFVKQKGLCFGCFEHGHRSKFCKQRRICKTCQKRHPTLLHGDIRNNKEHEKETVDKKETVPKSVQGFSGASHSNSNISNCDKCSMIMPVYISHRDNPDKEVLIYALLDTQSDTTFLLDKTCDQLGVKGTNVKLLLSTMFSKDEAVNSQRITGLIVRGYDRDVKISLPTTYTREIMPANESHIPTPEMALRWPQLEKIAGELVPRQDCDIGLLIGYNCAQALAPREVILTTDDGPYGQRTELGWGIVGLIDSQREDGDIIGVSHHALTYETPHITIASHTPDITSSVPSSHMIISLRTTVKEVINPIEVRKILEMDFNEKSTSKTLISQDDKQFISKISSEIHQRNDKHYEMPLPFRNDAPKLPNNRSIVLKRLNQLKVRLLKDSKYCDDYSKFINEIIENGYAERVPEEELNSDNGHVWYIPHHGVYHPKKPGKIRVVFDCSLRYMNESLNDHLLQGPDLTNALIGVLCRFRMEPIAIMCDIQQMFHQFHVNSEHRNYLRFLWWENNDYESSPTEFRMTVHLFGAASSPGCANFALKHIARVNKEVYGPDAADFIRRNFYVDDGLKSVSTQGEAVDLIKQSQKMCSAGALRLHKFVSNSKDVIASVPMEDRAKGIQNLELVHDSLPIERALGIQWCIESDTFRFRIELKDCPLTRRGILSTICSVYDPLGFISPVTLLGKQILQQMCRDRADWDDPLADELQSCWQRWRSDLFSLANLRINRCLKPEGFGKIVSAELHNFSDACVDGYGQCSYIRLENEHQQVHCSLVMAKSRVTPLKSVTIPRLELAAAVVSAKISALLQQELDYSDLHEVFWTDSRVVLGYISNDSKRFHVFVANRIEQIKEHTAVHQWRHVSSETNPADIASRGMKASQLVNNDMWWSGPDFLQEQTHPQSNDNSFQISDNDPEVKRIKTLATTTLDKGFPSITERLEYFSDWLQMRRAVAYCLRFVNILVERVRMRNPSKEPKQPFVMLSVRELQAAETTIIKHVQVENFKEEMRILHDLKERDSSRTKTRSRNVAIKSVSSLYRLDPFIDDYSILRVGGRIDSSSFSTDIKHPIILPRRGHVTQLIIRHFHEVMQHSGRGITINELRNNGYWIINCNSAVSQYIAKCVSCRRFRRPLQEQKMAPLPEERLEPSPPFTYVGADFFGPWLIKEGRKELKRYGVVFTCLACRAIHLETACSLTTDSFISSLRRFISIRGPIKQLRCDRGTNFVGARNELEAELQNMDQNKVKQYLMSKDCDYFEFKLNVPSASHMGGSWERQIRSVRNVLTSLLNHAGTQLDDESLRTFMCEAAAIINSRPLTVDNLNDPSSVIPLNPNMLLTMKSKVVLPPPGEFQREDLYSRKRWRRVQHLANEFWSRWKNEYLQNLQRRSKWINPKRDMRIGDVVIVRDGDRARSDWRLGRVADVFPDADGHVRKVRVRLSDPHLDADGKRVGSSAFLERPIHKLVLLLETEDNK